jgi:HEAT repeat protein
VDQPTIPSELKSALEAEEAGELNEIIRRHGPEHFKILRELATDKTEHRNKALYALGRWGDPRVIPDIERILSGLDETGRIAALDALGRLGRKQALTAVMRSSSDPSPQVRKMAIEALGRIGGPEARQQLRAIAEKDPQEWIRKQAAAKAAALR